MNAANWRASSASPSYPSIVTFIADFIILADVLITMPHAANMRKPTYDKGNNKYLFSKRFYRVNAYHTTSLTKRKAVII